MRFTKMARKLGQPTSITQLMQDLGDALSHNPEMIFMGGGNPARIDDVETLFEARLTSLMKDSRRLHRTLGVYQEPQGDMEFRARMADLLKNKFGWNVSAANIAISNGSQSAFFSLFNMFAGESDEGLRHVHLPMAPEYIGYSDCGLAEGMLKASRPVISPLDDHLFKYHVDFNSLSIADDCGALCVSRPTNPTGNVLTDSELEQLDRLAKHQRVPLIVDGAYGLPFPNIMYVDANPMWNENTIVVLSLSKLGLPGLRTGIVVASEEVIQTFTNMSTVMTLAASTMGPAIANQLLINNELLALSDNSIRPFYKAKADKAVSVFKKELGDLPWAVHQPEGAIFLWLWFRGLPITSRELYERLKKRGVLVVPGEGFFPGLADDWHHKYECIRVTYTQSDEQVAMGAKIIAKELEAIYALSASD